MEDRLEKIYLICTRNLRCSLFQPLCCSSLKCFAHMEWKSEELDRNWYFLHCASTWHLCWWQFHGWLLVAFSLWCFVLFRTVQLGALGCSAGCISAEGFKTMKATCLSGEVDPFHRSRKNFSYRCRRFQRHTSPHPESCEIANDRFLIAEMSRGGHAGAGQSCCQPIHMCSSPARRRGAVGAGKQALG